MRKRNIAITVSLLAVTLAACSSGTSTGRPIASRSGNVVPAPSTTPSTAQTPSSTPTSTSSTVSASSSTTTTVEKASTTKTTKTTTASPKPTVAALFARTPWANAGILNPPQSVEPGKVSFTIGVTNTHWVQGYTGKVIWSVERDVSHLIIASGSFTFTNSAPVDFVRRTPIFEVTGQGVLAVQVELLVETSPPRTVSNFTHLIIVS